MTEPDLSEFHDLKKGAPRRCSIAAARESLTPPDGLALTAAFADPSITSAQIARWLQARRLKVAGQTVARHRSKECSCDE